ncbi:MAG TPA: F0F1 ATP synthase subunit delta [Sulfurimonas sp. UBA12504]|nr:MAG: F0F1 ATP synthase subunit delta [Sulfurimonas sp. GWF2_37_8]DAB30148.1 MAG TPA: F0F1 ATP synthase subunit delta [Sulfurimonas sp. UBA12504]
MEELIAKRYIKALTSGSDVASIENMFTIFTALAESFKNEKFVSIVNNPNVNSKDKLSILLDAVKTANSSNINNFIKLLVENKRIEIIPALAAELKKSLSNATKTYSGLVYSDSDIDSGVIEQLSSGLSKKFDSNISLTFIKNDFNGIKVNVDSLGVEINFSKSRINSQMIEHIVKAI